MKPFNKVAIIGVGLIGGSIGLGIKKKRLASCVIGIGHHRKSINEALKIGAIDEGYSELHKIKGADLVILATPVGAIIKFLPLLSRFIDKDCVVIDVGSTKLQITEIAKKSGIEFVGCHPLCGLERKGPRNADNRIFQDSLCILTPYKNTRKETLRKVCDFWKALGSKIKILDAATHDRILAFVSHLPHTAAFSLMDCLAPGYLKFASGGLKDITRIADSDPLVWRDIFISNRKEILTALNKFKKSLCRLESFIRNNQPDKLEAFLEKARRKRNVFTRQA